MQDNLKHRYYSGPIRITREDGTPVANKELKLKQVRHEFLFGCNCFFSVGLLNHEIKPEENTLYAERLEQWLDLFNMATLPFYWGQYEPQKGHPRMEQLRVAAEYLHNRGILLKGHPLCWHTVTAPWLLDMSNEQIMEAQLDRIHRDVSAFKGLIDMWDAINEVVIMPVFDKYDNGITRLCKEKGRIKTVKAMFDAARAMNPKATLLINDFNMSQSYEILIEGLLDAGVSIDAIGLQSHQHQGYWGKEKIHEVLDRFSKFHLPLHFTENTIISGSCIPPEIEDLNDWQVTDWPSTPEYEERQMNQMKEMYETLFAHPLVEAIINWDFADGAWLNAPSGLIRKDNTKKPAYHELHRMIKEEWWTNTTIHTNEDGIAEVSCMYGDYEVEGDSAIIPMRITKISR